MRLDQMIGRERKDDVFYTFSKAAGFLYRSGQRDRGKS